MARLHASFDRWWNGISLRTKITGVTVALLTLGLTVAGVGTMTVLRNYLLEKVDSDVAALAREVDSIPGAAFATCGVTYEPNGHLFLLVDKNGRTICSNVPANHRAPDTSSLTLGWTSQVQGGYVTITDATGRGQWRVIATPVQLSGESEFSTLIVGIDLADVESTIARYAIIFFGFSMVVILLGAATTQLLVTNTFAPLRDVERTAARFAAGDYSQRLGGATPNTEVGRLNRSLNTMLARIDRAFADRQRTVDQMRRFVGDASHELRTPLVSVRGYAELYRMGAISQPDEVAQAMDRIEREAIRMGELVEDLLELARLDEAKPPQLAPVDLLPIAQDAALDTSVSAPNRTITVVVPEPETMMRPVPEPEPEPDAVAASGGASADARTPAATTMTGPIAFAGATIARLRRRRPRGEASAPAPQVQPLPEVGPIVLAEENKIRQVVTNLIGNAMRFTPDDSPIELVVEVEREAGYGVISVVDHGEGIPPQLREKIFQRFWRADTSRTRDTGGSGLGLAIVAGIIANHNGHVEVLETPGGGATFRVSLPLLPAEPESAESADDAAAPAKDARRP
jgi:two-component system OmpR family sensor kinase